MDIHYNAFISYRHHPEDIRVATEIHRALERYRIPKAVRKNQKGNLRLFRDKDELPITSNLSDDIFRALENSDYLIVICSTHTKESIWVQREIETFLRTHTYDKVLTVLVDGEPYDTIPEILQYREEADPDTGEMERIPIEPLSCDWRVGKKEAYREELPRLAAALLHCGYDELRQRQRQYKMRRMITFFSAALIASVSLTAYFLYTSIKIKQANDNLQAANEEIRLANEEIREANIQIQNNLDDALRNQSEYLASAAGELYDEGDRLNAIVLAMAALPSEENDRPYVADAEKTLTDVLSLYDSASSLVAAGAFNTGAIVNDFEVTDDEKVVFLYDDVNRITSWDANTYQQIASAKLLGNYMFDMMTVKDNLVTFMSVEYGSGDPKLCCYNKNCELIWSVTDCADFAVLDESTVMILQSDYAEGDRIQFLDVDTGRKVKDTLVLEHDEQSSSLEFCQDHNSSDTLVLLLRNCYSDAENKYLIRALDIQAESEIRICPLENWPQEERDDFYIQTASVTESGNILVSVRDSRTGAMNGTVLDMLITSPADHTVFCYSGENNRLMWKTELTSYSYSACSTLMSIPNSDRVFFQDGNTFCVLDGLSGDVVAQCESLGTVLSVEVDESGATGMLSSGSYFSYRFADNQCMALEMVDRNLIRAEIAGANYALSQLSYQVTSHKWSRQSGWTPLENTDKEIDIAWKIRKDDHLAVMSYDKQLVFYDIKNHNVKNTVQMDTSYYSGAKGFSGDCKKFYLENYGNVMVIDLESGNTDIREKRTDVLSEYADEQGFSWLYEDTLFYMLACENDLYLASLDLTDGDVETALFAQDVPGDKWTIGEDTGIVAASDRHALLWNRGALYTFDQQEKTFELLMEGLKDFPLCEYHESMDIFAICLWEETVLFRPGEGETLRLRHPEHKNVDLAFYQDMILAVDDEGALIRYDSEGNWMSETSLNGYNTFYSNADIEGGEVMKIEWFITDDGDLILDLFGMGNIIDCSQWRVKASIQQFHGYDPYANTLLSAYDGALGCYPRYSTAQVLEIARDQLGDYEMPADTKAYYGID